MAPETSNWALLLQGKVSNRLLVSRELVVYLYNNIKQICGSGSEVREQLIDSNKREVGDDDEVAVFLSKLNSLVHEFATTK